MMRTLRDNTKVILWILILVFVATIVFSWGMGGFDTVSSGAQSTVASVNGEDLDNSQYDRLVNNRLQQSGDRADNQQVLSARKSGWSDMINLALERQQASLLKLNSSGPEVADKIKYLPPPEALSDTNFQSNGVFDTLKWHDLLLGENMRNYLLAMEQNYFQSIPYQKLRSRIGSVAHSSVVNLEDDYLTKNQTASGRYLIFPYTSFDVDSAEISEQELQAWYSENKDDYARDEQREIEYVQFKVDPSSEDTLDANDTIDYILRQLDRGESFEDMASTYSMDDSNAEKGGDLGWFGRGRMVPAFEEAAFAAEVGEMVGPVATRFGLHLIKVNGHEDRDGADGTKEEQIQAQHILIKYEASTMTYTDLRAKADALYEDCLTRDFKELCDERGLEIKTGRPFTASGSVPGVGRSDRAAAMIFAAVEGKVLETVYNQRGGYFVIRLKKILPEGTRSFDEVRGELFTAVRKDKQQVLAQAAAEAWIASNSSVGSIDSTMATEGIEFGELEEPIKINQYIRSGNIGRDLAFASTLFTMPVGSISKAVKGERGVYVLECSKRQVREDVLGGLTDPKAKHDEVISTQSGNAYGSWARWAKDRAVVEDYRLRFGIEY